ncbi:SIMPL domain-containing protein [Gallaecimonas xiamenensis]|uniref:Periplasmic immunogenic protein n=1 Tax=Gallaecimonas xiamenensis 3-C-1 TaxID=745411 RepID=K2JBP8_9GAMM|nr:SIMPL domain-containing protein [Gallaecimonas xiamenensis]EKE72192.1 hypothetical protein B3C1_11489 [Gallaecimonas xiamenensis 3-C-1]
MKIKALALMLAAASPLGMAMDRYVSVQGEATRSVVPDQVSFSVAFSAEGQDADQLLKEIETKAAPFLAKLGALGIADKDIQGHRFEVFPRYDKDKMTGLRAQQRYQITVHGFALYPKVLKAAVEAKADQVGQGQLGYSQQDQLYQELLADAVRHARTKAKLLAEAGDAELGKLVSVDEQGGYQPPVMYMRTQTLEAKGAAVQTAGEMDVRASISARFALKD